MTSPCAACRRGCCHRYLVTVSGYDAWRIASTLRLAPEQFLVAVAQEKPDGKGFLLDRTEQTYDIALDKAAARTKEKPCVFWMGLPGGIGRCGIYPVRPHVCQTYPAILREDEPVRREDVLCAKPAWRDGTLQQPVWLRRLREMLVEHDVYRLVVARWNHHVTHTARPELLSLTGYYGYVLQFYERLAPVRERIEPAEWAALCEAWAGHLQRGRSPLVDDVPELRSWAWLFHDVVAAATGVIPAPQVEAAPIP